MISMLYIPTSRGVDTGNNQAFVTTIRNQLHDNKTISINNYSRSAKSI